MRRQRLLDRVEPLPAVCLVTGASLGLRFQDILRILTMHNELIRPQQQRLRDRQDFLEVWETNVLSSARRALLPHFGHFTLPFSCSRIDRVSVTSRWHLSQWYSYTGMAAPPTDSHPIHYPAPAFG